MQCTETQKSLDKLLEDQRKPVSRKCKKTLQHETTLCFCMQNVSESNFSQILRERQSLV